MNAEEARRRYIVERPGYEEFASRLAQYIRIIAVRERLGCTVTHRAKKVSSLVKKIILSKQEDPWKGIHDKAGVRIVVRHSGDLERAAEIVREMLAPVWGVDDRANKDAENKLDYPRLHFEVEASKLPDEAGFSTVDKRTCEIQLRTAAADLWATMSHKLLYKPAVDLPGNVRRALYGLLALVEVYDREVARAMDELAKLPDHYLTSVVSHAESIFYTFCANSYDSSLTREIFAVILGTINEDQRESYVDLLTNFAERDRKQLEKIFERYGPASEAGLNGSWILVGQPESIAIFERLSSQPMRLSDTWNSNLPEELLLEMKSIW